MSCDMRHPTTRPPARRPLTYLGISPTGLPTTVHSWSPVRGQAGSAATFTFTCTSVWPHGSKSDGNGSYGITLDGSTSVGEGFSDGDLFRQVVFVATGLDGNKAHRLAAENVGMNGTNLVVDSVSGIRLAFLCRCWLII